MELRLIRIGDQTFVVDFYARVVVDVYRNDGKPVDYNLAQEKLALLECGWLRLEQDFAQGRG